MMMPDFGPYAFYIVSAYAAGALCLITLFGATLFELRQLRRALKGFES